MDQFIIPFSTSSGLLFLLMANVRMAFKAFDTVEGDIPSSFAISL